MEELEIISRQEQDGIRAFINKVEYRSAHFHQEWELLWVLDTPLSITSGQKQYLIQPGELILFPPNYPHEFHQMERPCTFLCLQISPRFYHTAAHLRTEDIRLKHYLSAEDDRWVRKAVLDVAQAYWSQNDLSNLLYLGLTGILLHKFLTCLPFHVMTVEEIAAVEQRNARLMRLIQFVDENYMHKIRLSDFARQEGLSVSYLSHFVKNTMNQTFQDYVNSVRFNCARKLIVGGDDSLVSICMMSGFSDYRYFSRSFQKIYGITPAEYRRSARDILPEYAMPIYSLHSREHIYDAEDCLRLVQKFQVQLEQNI